MTWRYARKWNFIHAPTKSAVFPDPIFMKTTNSQQQYVQICFTEFHQNRTVNVDSMFRRARSKMRPLLQRFSRNVITEQF